MFQVSSATNRRIGRGTSGGLIHWPGPTTLRRDCLVTVIALVLQFGLGMILNLYVPVPSADAHAGFVTEVRTAPLGLTLHAMLGTFLVVAAIVVLAGAARSRDRLMTAFTATGLVSVIGAFAAGELFVREMQNGISLTMALLTALALLCYACTLARVKSAAFQSRDSG